MADESVIFEIQVDKKVLEQVFNENKHLKDSYEKLIKNEDIVKTLREEIASLKEEITTQKQINEETHEENIKLKARIKEIERERRILEERNKSTDLEQTESKLFKMKLQKVETEKSTIIEEYEKEMTIMEELLKDNSNLARIEEELKTTTEKLELTRQELEKTKKALKKTETENWKLDEDKFKLEVEQEVLKKKLCLEKERNICNDLEHVESKLLKLKLQSLEKEKNHLLDDFERERKIITKQNKPRVVKIEENLKYLKNWIENEAKQRRPRDSEEVKKLKAQIQSLEKDKQDIIEGFELERKVFQKILKANANYNVHLP